MTKVIARGAKKITAGAQHSVGKTWHGELSDKAASIKTHVYWSMKNCDKDANKLRANLDNIVEHYKQNHENCHPLSNCRTVAHYMSSKTKIEDPAAEAILTKFIHSMQVYKNAEYYKYCSLKVSTIFCCSITISGLYLARIPITYVQICPF